MQKLWLQKEINQADGYDSRLVTLRFYVIFNHDYFFEGVIDIEQGCRFLALFGIGRHYECRLDIIALTTSIYYKINLILFSYTFAIFSNGACFHNSDIHRIPSHP